MRASKILLGLTSSLTLLGGVSVAPAVSYADTTESYVACNQYDQCWHVHKRYTFSGEKIVYHDSAWRDDGAHWVGDPADDRGYYDRDGSWHTDPAARAVAGGAVGAGVGAAIGCVVTIVIGCAPGAAAGAAIGGGAGAVTGAATTPDHR
jgi:hypothetical protein